MNKEKIVFFWLPLICQILCIYNLVLIRFGISHLYLFVYVLSLITLLFCKKSRVDSKKRLTMVTVFYLATLLLCYFIQILIGYDPKITSLGIIFYSLPVMYWLVYYIKVPSNHYFPSILYSLRYHVLVAAILAFVQYFLSPTLFGIYNPENPGDIGYIDDSSYSSFSSFFLRASSILNSPQQLGLFMSLYSVFFFYIRKKNIIDMVMLVVFLFAGAFSGSKSFFFCITLFILYSLIRKNTQINKKNVLSVAILSIALIVAYQDEFGFLMRAMELFDTSKLYEHESGVRFQIYKSFIDNIRFEGVGAGITQHLGNQTIEFTTESYWLQIIYELGVIPFLAFFTFAIKSLTVNKNIIVFLCFISMIYVHCFNAFLFFIWWGVIFNGRSLNENLCFNDSKIS